MAYTGVLGTNQSGLGNLLLSESPGLGAIVAGTVGLVLLYNCDDQAGQTVLIEQFGRNATIDLGTTAYSVETGIDGGAIVLPDATPAVSPPPYTKGTAPHATATYSGADIDIGDAGTIEVWFKPSEWGDGPISSFDPTPTVPYTIVSLSQPGVGSITLETLENGDGAGGGALIRVVYTSSSGGAAQGFAAGDDGITYVTPFIPAAILNRWYYLVFTWDSTGSAVYTNGDFTTTGYSSPLGPISLTNCNFQIGPNGGAYDLIALTNRRMSYPEIRARFTGGTVLAPTSNVRVTSMYANVLATYDRNLRVSRQAVEVLRTGSRDLRVTRQAVEVLRSTRIGASGSSSETLTFTESVNYDLKGVGTASDVLGLRETVANTLLSSFVVTVAASDTLVFTQSVRPIRDGTISDTLTFTETPVGENAHSTSDTLDFDETVAFTMVHVRGLLDALTFTETEVNVASHNVSFADTLDFTETVSFGYEIDQARLQTLTFSETVIGNVSHIYTATASDSLTFSEGIEAGPAKQGSASDLLLLIGRFTLQRAYHRELTDTLTFTETVPRLPRTIVVAASDTLTFYDDFYPLPLPLQVAGVPVVLSLPVASGTVASGNSVILQSGVGAVVLPLPEFSDTDQNGDTVTVKRTMTGKYYTYVQTSPTRLLKYDFVLGRLKAIALRAFMVANQASLVTLTNWKGETFYGQFTTNPVTITTAGRWADAAEKCTVTLEFEGVPV